MSCSASLGHAIAESRRPSRILLALVPFLAVSVGAEAQVVSGSYVGDGSSGRAITGLGFRPDIVLISSNELGLTPGDERRSVIRTSTMSGNLSKSIVYNDADPLADRIQSLDSNGFTVGHPFPEDVDARYTCVNHAGVTYYWTAFRAAPGVLKLGSYTGDGADDRNITGVGFQPDYVIVMPEGVGWSYQRSSAMAGDTGRPLLGETRPVTSRRMPRRSTPLYSRPRRHERSICAASGWSRPAAPSPKPSTRGLRS